MPYFYSAKSGPFTDPTTWGGSTYPFQPQAISAVSNNGSGLVRITLSVADGAWGTGDKALITGVAGLANFSLWTITKISSTQLDLQGSTFTAAAGAGGVVRRASDSPYAQNGHAITVDDDVFGGTGDTGTNFTVNAGCTLTIATGKKLSYANSINVNGATLNFYPGSILEMGIASGSVGLVANSSTTIRTVGTGPGSNRSTMRKIAGSAGFSISSPGVLNLSYANLSGMTGGGSSGTRWLGSTDSLTLDHCQFDGCGSIGESAVPLTLTAAGTLAISASTWRNSVATPMILGITTTPTGGTRSVANCNFDIAPSLGNGAMGVTFPNCLFSTAPGGSNTVKTGLISNSLVVTPTNGASGSIAPGDMTDCYNLLTEVGQTNGFFYYPPTGFGVTLTRHVFDAPFLATSYGNVPDCFYATEGSTAGVVHELAYCLVLPVAVGSASDSLGSYNSKGTTSGCLQSGSGLPNGRVKIRLRHNTACSRTRGQGGAVTTSGDGVGPFLNEGVTTSGGTSAAGSIDVHRDNLFWDDSASGNYGYASNVHGGGGLGPDNCLNPANTSNNVFFGMTKIGSADSLYAGKTNLSTYYATPTSGSVPGANDVTLASPPNFVDPTRSFLTWGRTLAGTLTNTDTQAVADVAAALAQMFKSNDDSGYDARYSIAALLAWVRAGWAPRNVALKNTALDTSAFANAGAIAGIFPAGHSLIMTGCGL